MGCLMLRSSSLLATRLRRLVSALVIVVPLASALADLSQLDRECNHTGKRALREIIEIAKNSKEPVDTRLSAIELIWNPQALGALARNANSEIRLAAARRLVKVGVFVNDLSAANDIVSKLTNQFLLAQLALTTIPGVYLATLASWRWGG